VGHKEPATSGKEREGEFSSRGEKKREGTLHFAASPLRGGGGDTFHIRGERKRDPSL